MDFKVKKRDGSLEDFDINKIHKIIDWSIDGLSGVSLSDLVVHAKLKFYDGIETRHIHDTLVKSASELISLEAPNYQYVAARLLLFQLRKQVWGGEEAPKFYDFVTNLVAKEIYDPSLLDKYTKEEIEIFGGKIDHDRDYLFSYSGLRQMTDKYLIKDRSNNAIFETPQIAYMALSMVAFQNYPKETRASYVFKAYDYISKFKISLPTPIVSGLRTIQRQYASCTLIDIGDTMNSITNALSSVMKYTAARAGIGLNIGSMRAINSKIRKGEVTHTGLIPFLKTFESAVKSCSQNGLRGGGATVTIPWWHYEVQDIVVLKNNAGTDDNRVRKLDYTVAMSKIIYQRFIEDSYVTLFCPHEAKGLYEAFGTEKFDELYCKLEDDSSLKFKKKVKARDLLTLITTERIETGRIYILNIDHVNTHGAFKDIVKMANLCVTGDTVIDILVDNGDYKSVCIKDLGYFLKNNKNVKVRSFNINSKQEEYAEISDFAQTGESVEIVEIEDEGGNIIKCTPEHQIYTKNRGYVMAKDLIESDILENS